MDQRYFHDRKKITDAFTEEWVKQNINDPTNELVILRKVIPWQRIINRLVHYYDDKRGRIGNPLRVVIAVFIVARLRSLSDRLVIAQIRENRYMQYFCNVPDQDLANFINPSSLSKLRKRFGVRGMKAIESTTFHFLRLAGVIKGETMLIDSTVLPSNILYPTDVGLIFKAFGKMRQLAERYNIPLWWNDKEVKQLWRKFNLNKKKDKIAEYLFEFALMFSEPLEIFEKVVGTFKGSDKEEEGARKLLELLILLEKQNEQKLKGEKHIANRIVSLDEPDTRPIKKGKKHPSCEFGTTLQLSFNREGFMITMENLMGKPDDKTLWPGTSKLFEKRMKRAPETAVGDKGYRSRKNRQLPEKTPNIFLGKSSDVTKEKQGFCQKARSATEGFIAVAKHLRGFGRSLYRGFSGDCIWSLLCQTAYNLKKFLQLWRNEEIEEKGLIKLGLLA